MSPIGPDNDSINRRIETEVLTAMEEEDGHVATFSKRAKRETEEEDSIKEVRSSKRVKKNPVRRVVDSPPVNDLPLNVEVTSFQPAALVTPEVHCPKPQVSFSRKSSSYGSEASDNMLPFTVDGNRRRCLYPDSSNSQRYFPDLAPPLYRSPSDHSLLSTVEYHTDERIAFEGQHFHYLDSFAVHGSETTKVTPTPEPFSRVGMPSSRYSSTISLPHLVSNLSDEDLLYGVRNSSVIATTEAPDFNPKTIFAEDGDDPGWAIDIDQEFLMMKH